MIKELTVLSELSNGTNPKCRVLFFWAPWNEASKPGGTMDEVFRSLVSMHHETTTTTTTTTRVVDYCRVEAEAVPELSRKVRWSFVNYIYFGVVSFVGSMSMHTTHYILTHSLTHTTHTLTNAYGWV